MAHPAENRGKHLLGGSCKVFNALALSERLAHHLHEVPIQRMHLGCPETLQGRGLFPIRGSTITKFINSVFHHFDL